MAKGETRIVWNDEYRAWQFEPYSMLIAAGKPRNGGGQCGPHTSHAVIELLQRGVLLAEGDALVLSKEARKTYGEPPTPPPPKRTVTMSRTRAARVQP